MTTSPGQSDPGAGPTTGTPATGAPTSGPGVGPSGQPPRPPKTPSDPRTAGPLTISGTIAAGVEPNCLLLNGYLLINGPRDVLRAGARVTVTGRPKSDLMTTCQQGTPFLVETAKPA